MDYDGLRCKGNGRQACVFADGDEQANAYRCDFPYPYADLVAYSIAHTYSAADSITHPDTFAHSIAYAHDDAFSDTITYGDPPAHCRANCFYLFSGWPW